MITILGLSLLCNHANDSDSGDKFLPTLYIVCGCGGLLRKYYARKKWINDRLKSKIFQTDVELIFTDNSLISNGKFSSGELLWSGMNSIKNMQKGILLRPETGIVIYVPKSAFQSQENIDEVLSKLLR